MKKLFRVVSIGSEQETIKIGNDYLQIQDISPGHGGDEIHPLIFKRNESVKLVEFLNSTDKNLLNTIVNRRNRIHWNILFSLKRELKFGDYAYFRKDSLKFKDHNFKTKEMSFLDKIINLFKI